VYSIKIKGKTLPKIEVDFDNLLRSAGRAFIESANKEVPVDTGFARGTFRGNVKGTGESAETFFNTKVRIDMKVKQKRNRLGRFTAVKRTPSEKLKNPARGATLGQYTYNSRLPNLQFGFGIKDAGQKPTLDYFELNDRFSIAKVKSSPWSAFNRGYASFKSAMKDTKANSPITFTATKTYNYGD
jgi:hypothetical protein